MAHRGHQCAALLLTAFALAVACSAGNHSGSQTDASAALFDSGTAGEADPIPSGDLESMLHWAIEHSDPNALKEAASSARNATEDAQRRTELREVMEAMRQVTPPINDRLFCYHERHSASGHP